MQDQYLVVAENTDDDYHHEFSLFGSSRKSRRGSTYATAVDTYEDAEKEAKRLAFKNQGDYLIFKAIAAVETQVPDLKVTKITNK